MSALLVILLIIIIALVIIGMGWSNFLTAVFNGFEKVRNSPLVKNITETSKTEVNKLINNTTK